MPEYRFPPSDLHPDRSDDRYAVAFERGTLQLGLYAPRGNDGQSPHDQDEVYVVVKGRARLRNGETVHDVEQGEALFVAAGVEHRFEGMSDDFEAWVVFYGPPGGEG